MSRMSRTAFSELSLNAQSVLISNTPNWPAVWLQGYDLSSDAQTGLVVVGDSSTAFGGEALAAYAVATLTADASSITGFAGTATVFGIHSITDPLYGMIGVYAYTDWESTGPCSIAISVFADTAFHGGSGTIDKAIGVLANTQNAGKTISAGFYSEVHSQAEVNAAFYSVDQGSNYGVYIVGGNNNLGPGVTNVGTLIESVTHTPASASDTGKVGQFAWDANFVYVCTAVNSWKRAALVAW